MNLLKHISNVAGFQQLKTKSRQLKAKKTIDSDNLTLIKTIPENAKYPH